MASNSGASDLLASAKAAAASAQTTVGQQAEKVGVAAGEAKKTVGQQAEKVGVAAGEAKKTVTEYVDKAADAVHSKPADAPPKSEGVFAGVTNAVGGLFKGNSDK